MAHDELICRNPGILGGTPVFAGTRVPIQNLFDYLKEGSTLDQFLYSFPSVTREQAQRVLELAQDEFLARV